MTDYNQEVECTYKGERYSVRNNGAVLRHPREDKRKRKYDNKWTFGKPNSNGYMRIGTEVVHRIVATAFHGEPPTPQHIVEHIDTNRQNNRPENLRWLTRLENTLNNPITRKRIKLSCGSIEAFLKDPSMLKNHETEDPNFSWMKSVTSEEARISLKRLNDWAKKEGDNSSSRKGELGDWIFEDKHNKSSSQKSSEHEQESNGLIESKTLGAVQKNWNTPSEFPSCPEKSTDNPITTYNANLKVGEVFSRNKYSNSIIADIATSKDGNTIWLICKSGDNNAVKPWFLAEVTYENDLFVHTNLGSFFKKKSVEKQFTLVQGLEWTGGNTFEDLIS